MKHAVAEPVVHLCCGPRISPECLTHTMAVLCEMASIYEQPVTQLYILQVHQALTVMVARSGAHACQVT